MKDDADQAADQSAIDPDILQVTADRALQPVRDRTRIPGADGLRNQGDDAVAIRGDDADRGAARELVDCRLEPRLGLQRLAELAQRLAEAAGKRRIGVAGALEQAGTGLFPDAVEPGRDRL